MSYALAMIGCVTKHQLRRFGSLVVEVNVLIPGEADSSMNLHCQVAYLAVSVARIRFRDRYGHWSLGRVVAHQPGGVIHRRPRAFGHQKHVGAVMLNGLKLTDW